MKKENKEKKNIEKVNIEKESTKKEKIIKGSKKADSTRVFTKKENINNIKRYTQKTRNKNNIKGAKNTKSIKSTTNTALYGMLIALAFILSYIEYLLPINFGIPGIKLGLANIVVLVALYMMGYHAALVLTVIRVMLIGFTFSSGLYHIVYGLSGALLSFIVMAILHKSGKFSILGVSIAGGVSHNIGQIIVAMIILSKFMAYYFPFLLIGGLVSGALIGILGSILVSRIN